MYDDDHIIVGKSALACYTKSNIKLSQLGFEEVKYHYLPTSIPSSTSTAFGTTLKAVIPSESQNNLLDSIIFGELNESPLSPYQSNRKSERSEPVSKLKTKKKSQKRPKSASSKPGWRHPFIGLPLNLERNDYLPTNIKHKLKEDEELQRTLKIERHKGEKVRSVNGKPVYTQISQHKVEWDRKRKEKEDERSRKERIFKTLICNREYQVTDKDGVHYCFDTNGAKIREDEYLYRISLEKEKESKEQELKELLRRQQEEKRQLEKEKGKKWSGLILDRTKHQMEVLEHKKLAEEKFTDRVWKPLKFPTTTFSMYNNKTNRRTRSLPHSIIRHWPEYDSMEIGDVIITIEHCDNCSRHESNTRHDESHYKKRIEKVKDALHPETLKFAIRFTTLLKPISKFGTHISNSIEVNTPTMTTSRPKSALARTKTWIPPITPLPTEVKTRANPDQYQNDFNYRSRVGAFEVQVAYKTNKGELKVEILHTKLLSGSWGNDNKITLFFNEFLRRHQVDELFSAVSMDKVDFTQDTVFPDGTLNYFFDSRSITLKRQTVGSLDPDLMQDASIKELSATQKLRKINSQNVLKRIDSRELVQAEAKGLKRNDSMGAMTITSDIDLFGPTFTLGNSSKPNSPKQSPQGSFTLAELSSSPHYYDFKLGKEVHRPINTIPITSSSEVNLYDAFKTVQQEIFTATAETLNGVVENSKNSEKNDEDLFDANTFKEKTKKSATKFFFLHFKQWY